MFHNGVTQLALRVRCYAGVGVISTAVHYSCFVTLTSWQGAWLASLLGSLCGMVSSFLLNRTWTFPMEGEKRLQPLRFFLVAFSLIGANALLMHWLLAAGIVPLLAQVISTTLLAGAGFIIHQFWSHQVSDVFKC